MMVTISIKLLQNQLKQTQTWLGQKVSLIITAITLPTNFQFLI